MSATAQASAWNLCWKPGTPVTVSHGGRRVTTRTASLALAAAGDAMIAVDPVDGIDALQSLGGIRPATAEMIEAAALRGRM